MAIRKLAPSILNADFSDLRKAVACISDAADVIHLDVMDGNFVPNITFGPVVVAAIRSISQLPLDVHLMIGHPEAFADDFIKVGADWLSFHAEVAANPRELLERIKEKGVRAGVAINPATPASVIFECLDAMDFALVMSVVPGFGGQEMMVETLSKIPEIKHAAAARGIQLEVEVDGGVNSDNLKMVVDAGADIIVAGSSIYGAPDPRLAALKMRELLDF